jgi:hypothetical protein
VKSSDSRPGIDKKGRHEMRHSSIFGIIFLLIFTSLIDQLLSQDNASAIINVSAGVIWGNFEDLNDRKAITSIDNGIPIAGTELFDKGRAGTARFDYRLTSRSRFAVEVSYLSFEANDRTRFRSNVGEELGIRDWPLYRIWALPITACYILERKAGNLHFTVGPGAGFQWVRLREDYPAFPEAMVFSAFKYRYGGSSLVLKISGEIARPLTKHFSLSIPLSYQYAMVNKMKLSFYSGQGTEPESDILVDTGGKRIPIDLSGFTVGIGLNLF